MKKERERESERERERERNKESDIGRFIKRITLQKNYKFLSRVQCDKIWRNIITTLTKSSISFPGKYVSLFSIIRHTFKPSTMTNSRCHWANFH